MNTIKISKSRINSLSSTSRLEADISINKKSYTMYYEVEKQYEKYLTTDVSDAFLVCLMLYAMEHNYNMEFEGNLSEDLHEQILNYLMPAIYKNIEKYNKIDIKYNNLISPKYNPKYIATGISCGVDSLYTIFKNLNHSQESQLNINALTFFNAGASGGNGGEDARFIYNERIKLAKEVADKLNLPLITVDSNMNEFLQQDHEATHVFRTLSIPLAMQQLFKLYYFSSGTPYNLFKFTDFDPAYYDILNMQLLSTSNTRFFLVGGETTRMGKIEFISNNKIAHNHLNVCISDISNCSKCSKCIRTMFNLYLINKLDKFNNVFDIDLFYKNFRKNIRWICINNKKPDLDEIYSILKYKKLIKFSDKCYIFFYKTAKFFKVDKIVRKLKRLFKKKHN